MAPLALAQASRAAVLQPSRSRNNGVRVFAQAAPPTKSTDNRNENVSTRRAMVMGALALVLASQSVPAAQAKYVTKDEIVAFRRAGYEKQKLKIEELLDQQTREKARLAPKPDAPVAP